MPTGVYTRTKPVWNKGKHTGQIPWDKGLKKGMDPRMANVGTYPRTEHHRQVAINNLRVLFGKPAWNKGLTKENHPGIARGAEAVRVFNLGKHHSEETKAKMRISSPFKGVPCSEEKKQNLREKNKGQVPWNKGLSKQTSPGVLEQSIKLANIWDNVSVKNSWLRKLRRAANQRPNKLEIELGKILENAFPGEWLYTGNGLITIGGMIPDFTNINGQKIVIEAFGNYWHKDEDPQSKIDKYSKFGYGCVVVWENEVKQAPNAIVEKIIGGAKWQKNGEKLAHQSLASADCG